MAANRRAHRFQWRNDALHWPAGQRCVTDKTRVERLARKQARHQPHGRTRIAHVERRVRGTQAVQADTVDRHRGRIGLLDFDAHGGHRCKCRQAVFAVQKPADVGRAAGNTAKHDGTMRNRLVPRYSNGGVLHAAGLHAEFHQPIALG